MRLVELDPQWWAVEGRTGQGIVFRCPHCRSTYLCVAFVNPLDGGAPWDVGTPERRPISPLWDVLYGPYLESERRYPGRILQPGIPVVPPGVLWRRTGETFGDLSIMPSVDASRAGCWHGFVTGGEVR